MKNNGLINAIKRQTETMRISESCQNGISNWLIEEHRKHDQSMRIKRAQVFKLMNRVSYTCFIKNMQEIGYD